MEFKEGNIKINNLLIHQNFQKSTIKILKTRKGDLSGQKKFLNVFCSQVKTNFIVFCNNLTKKYCSYLAIFLKIRII